MLSLQPSWVVLLERWFLQGSSKFLCILVLTHSLSMLFNVSSFGVLQKVSGPFKTCFYLIKTREKNSQVEPKHPDHRLLTCVQLIFYPLNKNLIISQIHQTQLL